MIRYGFLLTAAAFLLSMCREGSINETYAYNPDTGALRAVIETTAGTVEPIIYSREHQTFETPVRDGKPVKFAHTPCPVNWGFVPGTFHRREGGGDNSEADVLVLALPVPQGSLVECEVLGLLRFRHEDTDVSKIIALPTRKAYRLVEAESFDDLRRKYPELLIILQKWFESYAPDQDIEYLGRADEEAARAYIDSLRIN